MIKIMQIMTLTKPRTKGKYKSDFKLKDAYKYYKQNTIKELQQDYTTWSTIVKKYFTKSIEGLLTQNETIKLSSKLGEIDVRKTKPKLIRILKGERIIGLIDWKNTKKYGRTIHHTNDHRDGYIYRFCWLNRGAFKNKTLYSFTACRKNSRLLSLILQKYDKSQIDWPEK
jgi:hypothetical protein